MEKENIENLDSKMEETDIVADENDDVDALKEKFEKVSNTNKQLFERAKKAETEARELKQLKAETEAKKGIETPSHDINKSNEPDYARLAFLEQRGLSHPDDQKLVQDEAVRLKLPLTDILNMGHIKSQLETNKDQRESQAGMPKGRGNATGRTQQDVDYWLQKGETPDDLELAEKVIDARIKKEQSGNKFSDTMFTG